MRLIEYVIPRSSHAVDGLGDQSVDLQAAECGPGRHPFRRRSAFEGGDVGRLLGRGFFEGNACQLLQGLVAGLEELVGGLDGMARLPASEIDERVIGVIESVTGFRPAQSFKSSSQKNHGKVVEDWSSQMKSASRLLPRPVFFF